MQLTRGPFAASELAAARADISGKHAQQLEVGKACHDQLCTVLAAAQWSSNTADHVVHALAARALEHFACALISLAQGTIPAAKLLTRALIEIAYKLRAIQSSPELVQQFLEDDRASTLLRLRGFHRYKARGGHQGIAAGIERNIDELKALKANKWEPHQWATADDMADFHNMFYHWLSEHVHSSASAIDEVFVDDPD